MAAFPRRRIAKGEKSMMTRRDFLKGVGATVASAAACGPRVIFAKERGQFDEHLAVFLSDIHVNGLDKEGEGWNPRPHMRRYIKENVEEILKMDPLPAHVFIFGDIAYLQGRLVDYKYSRPYLQMLVDAGISLTLAMGNHDHRKAFLEVWPEYAGRTLIPGAIHTVTHCADYDLVMLDSLNEKEGVDAWNPTAGALSKAAQEWILEELPKWPRPFFIGAHHPPYELKFGADGKKRIHDHISTFPNCRGYIHGHDHIWKTNTVNWKNPNSVPWLTLPSNGCWGDLGYVTMRVADGEWHGRRVARACFVQKDFILPGEYGTERPLAWAARKEDVKGAKCTFVL